MNIGRDGWKAMSHKTQKCDNCYKRPGRLTHQRPHGPCGTPELPVPRFVFRYYHCPWCLGWENRRRRAEGYPPLKPIEWKPDEEVMKQWQP